ncbi:OsmC family protein [candidate division KSB1 bacterium]|nr:OsmC family protein [candidate division KSB1 bacterium]
MKAEIKQINGLSLAGKGDSGHWVTMDGPALLGGADAGARPLELFLMGLGGCTSMDVISIIRKKRIKLDNFECHLEAERKDEHPKVFTKLKIHFIFWGKDIPREAVERAIELSETTYCSASAMLKKAVDIETSYEIRES